MLRDERSLDLVFRVIRGKYAKIVLETHAVFVKELGNKFEKTMVETLREFSNIIPLYEWPSQLQNLFEDATLRIPSNSLRGGTTEIMKGIIARQLGLR